MPYNLYYNKDSQNIAASFVTGAAELYSRKDWPAKNSMESGIMNVENQPLVEPSKIFVIHAFKDWSQEKFCKGHEPRRSCLYLITRNVSQTK